jgi:hypothetical protein
MRNQGPTGKKLRIVTSNDFDCQANSCFQLQTLPGFPGFQIDSFPAFLHSSEIPDCGVLGNQSERTR